MNRKHYVKMAEAFNKALVAKDAEKLNILQLVQTFCQIAKEDNSNFDTTRFYNVVEKN